MLTQNEPIRSSLFCFIFLFACAQLKSEELRPPIVRSTPTAVFSFDGSVHAGLSGAAIQAKRLENVPAELFSRFPVGFSKNASFSVQTKGGLADRLFLDVDYRQDDRNSSAEQDSKIVLKYMGKKGELLKELYLGDAELALPGARWLSPKGRAGKISKQSFAVQSVFNYRNFDLTMIGSHQKGKPEVEHFNLGANAQRYEVRDVDYLQRTFYLVAPEEDLPLDPQSLIVFHDDGNGLNNSAATEKFVPEGANQAGFYDRLIANETGRGYELNPQTGVLRVLFDLPFNSSLAVSYRSFSGKTAEKRMIKSEDDSVSSELKNAYLLPENFQELIGLTVQDRSGNKTDAPLFSLDPIKQFLTFNSTHPFSKEVYQFPSSHQRTIILTYLSFMEKTTIALSKPARPETVRVTMNGRPAKEGTDYSVLSGGRQTVISLYGTHYGDKISVSYHSKDFPQTRQMFGGALTYGKDSDPFSVSLSGLTDFAPRGTRAPFVGADSAEVQMFGASLKGNDRFGKARARFNLEAAGSQYNPNPFGASLVENFDEARRSSKIEMREEFWKPSATPPGAQGKRSSNPIAFGSLPSREIVLSNPSEQGESFLSMESGGNEWFGVHRALAPKKGFVDLRSFRHLEFFVFSDGVSGAQMNIELGEISEDSNGNRRLDGEDSNQDGFVDRTEDSGFLLENGFLFGSKNNFPDTEDVNLDGRLNVLESSVKTAVPLGWSGWKKVRVPLESVRSARFLRMWVQGAARIKIAQVEFVGLEYSEEVSEGSSLAAGTVSGFSDPDAPSLTHHPAFKNLYPERIPGKNDLSEFERARQEDFALSLDYRLTPGGLAAVKREVDLDLTDQNEIHFFVASTVSVPAIFFLRLGSREHYFEFTVVVNQLNSAYKEFSVHRARFKRVGSPDWRNIREVRIGLFNPVSQTVSGRVFFNELFVSRPIVRRSLAFAGESELFYPLTLGRKTGEFFLKFEGQKVPSDFRTPDEFLRGHEKFQFRAGWKAPGSFMEVSRERELLSEALSGNGTGSSRFLKSDELSDKAHWDFSPRFGYWEYGLSGQFEKRQRFEHPLKESVENSRIHLSCSNSALPDWLPKRTKMGSSFQKDLALRRDQVSGNIEPTWRAFNGGLIFSPKADFEETVHSASGFIASRKGLLGFQMESAIPIWKASNKKIKMEGGGSSENSIQRSNFSSLSLARSVRGGASVRWGVFGNSSCGSYFSEKKQFTSKAVLERTPSIWKRHFKSPPFEPESLDRVTEVSFSQENIRISPLLKRVQTDWFGFSFRASARKENNYFFGKLSKEESVQFPNLTLIFSTGSWNCSAGISLNKMRGTGKKGEVQIVPLELGYKKNEWEIRNSFNFKKETQERTGGADTDLRANKLNSSLKVKFGDSFYQPLKFMRRNLHLENRFEFKIETEVEQRQGRQNYVAVEDLTLKAAAGIDYFIKESVNVYAKCDGWYFENKLASSLNYFAYTATVGTRIVF